MGGVCASKVDYAFQLDDSGLGFTADEMDLWDWEKLTDYVKGKPIRQYELDCAFKRFRLLCAEALTRKAGGGHHHHHHQKGAGAGNHGKKQGKLAKMSFKDLDPHFSKQVIDTFGAAIQTECAEDVVSGMFQSVDGRRLTFVEFLGITYDYCALPAHALFVHMLCLFGAGDLEDMYDDTNIDHRYVSAMMTAVHGDYDEVFTIPNYSLQTLFAAMPLEEDGSIPLGRLLRFLLVHPALFFALQVFQRLVRRKMLGDMYWEEHAPLPDEGAMARFGLHRMHILTFRASRQTGESWQFTCRAQLLQQLDKSHLLHEVVHAAPGEEPPRLVARLQAVIDAGMAGQEGCLHGADSPCKFKDGSWKPVTPCGLCRQCAEKARAGMIEDFGYKWTKEAFRLAANQVEHTQEELLTHWQEYEDRQSKHPFYYNTGSGESQWGWPEGWEREYSDSEYDSEEEARRLRKEEKAAKKAKARAAREEAEAAFEAAKVATGGGSGNKVVPI